jgi:hypothetical protein
VVAGSGIYNNAEISICYFVLTALVKVGMRKNSLNPVAGRRGGTLAHFHFERMEGYFSIQEGRRCPGFSELSILM